MKLSASFLLAVGLGWGLVVVWVFLSIGGVADAPDSISRFVFFWGGMLIGPTVLTVGSMLLLLGRWVRPGTILIATGCAILTGLILYNGVAEMRRRLQPLEALPPHWLYVVFLIVMLLSDVAAYRVAQKALWSDHV